MSRLLPWLVLTAALAVQGCSACSAVDESDLIPRRDTGARDGGPSGVDSTVPRPDAGGGGGGLGDPNDCGGRTCSDLEICLDERCQCRTGRTRVEGRCIDLSSDPDNCGEPGHRCETGVCADGECRDGCPDGTTQCGEACVRPLFDAAHCGECNNQCARDEFCDRGSCARYRGGTGCSSCPCAACTGDLSTCCTVAVLPGAVACIDADRCPGT